MIITFYSQCEHRWQIGIRGGRRSASDDAEGYLDFSKGKITESHLAQELLEKIDNGRLAPGRLKLDVQLTDSAMK